MCMDPLSTDAQVRQCRGHLEGCMLKIPTIQNLHLQDKEAGTQMKSVLTVVFLLCTTLTHSFQFDRLYPEKQRGMVAVCCLQSWQRHSKKDHTSFYRCKKGNGGRQ